MAFSSFLCFGCRTLFRVSEPHCFELGPRIPVLDKVGSLHPIEVDPREERLTRMPLACGTSPLKTRRATRLVEAGEAAAQGQ
jgi:hypothetical protein